MLVVLYGTGIINNVLNALKTSSETIMVSVLPFQINVNLSISLELVLLAMLDTD